MDLVERRFAADIVGMNPLNSEEIWAKCWDTDRLEEYPIYAIALIDIAINREEVYKENSRIPFFKSYIMDIGDLSVFYGIEEFDCTGFEFDLGLISDEELKSVSNLKESDLKKYPKLASTQSLSGLF